jgi:hypothetical protein
MANVKPLTDAPRRLVQFPAREAEPPFFAPPETAGFFQGGEAGTGQYADRRLLAQLL